MAPGWHSRFRRRLRQTPSAAGQLAGRGARRLKHLNDISSVSCKLFMWGHEPVHASQLLSCPAPAAASRFQARYSCVVSVVHGGSQIPFWWFYLYALASPWEHRQGAHSPFKFKPVTCPENIGGGWRWSLVPMQHDGSGNPWWWRLRRICSGCVSVATWACAKSYTVLHIFAAMKGACIRCVGTS